MDLALALGLDLLLLFLLLDLRSFLVDHTACDLSVALDLPPDRAPDMDFAALDLPDLDFPERDFVMVTGLDMLSVIVCFMTVPLSGFLEEEEVPFVVACCACAPEFVLVSLKLLLSDLLL